MTPPWVSNLIQRFSSSRPGAWLLARLLPVIDRWWFYRRRGSETLTAAILNLPTVMVTTIGAKSGLPRTVPLLYISPPDDPATFALIATNFGQERYPSWYFNLKANPRAVCTRNGETREYLAHEAIDEEYQRYWELAVKTYFGYNLYKQRIQKRPIPILVLKPVSGVLESSNPPG